MAKLVFVALPKWHLTYALPKWLVNLEDELNKCNSDSTTVSSKMRKKLGQIFF